ncbi:MAG: hypothetical protein P4L38_04010 [Syntrophaceae bacterium]|nr:hypothetical protein [Syntrophaceae bacterium]
MKLVLELCGGLANSEAFLPGIGSRYCPPDNESVVRMVPTVQEKCKTVAMLIKKHYSPVWERTTPLVPRSTQILGVAAYTKTARSNRSRGIRTPQEHPTFTRATCHFRSDLDQTLDEPLH